MPRRQETPSATSSRSTSSRLPPNAGVRQNPVRLIRVSGVSRRRRNNGLAQRAERVVVALGDGAAPGQQSVELLQLLDADSGLQIGHPVVEAELAILLEHDAFRLMARQGRDARGVGPQLPRPLRDVAIVGRQHTAFTRRNRLSRVKAEAGDVAGGADRAAVMGRPDRAGRVLDNRDSPARKAFQPIEIRSEPDLMNRENGLRARGDALLDVPRDRCSRCPARCRRIRASRRRTEWRWRSR